MNIKSKFIVGFVSIALLVGSLIIFVISNINKSSDGFSQYREMARDTVLASHVEANMLMVRMNVKDYLSTHSQKDLDEFNMYYNQTMKYVEEALVEIKKPSRAPKVKIIHKDLKSMKKISTKL